MEEVDKGCLMIRIQDGCEWVNVSSGTGPVHPGSPGQRAVKHLCVCVCVVRVLQSVKGLRVIR